MESFRTYLCFISLLALGTTFAGKYPAPFQHEERFSFLMMSTNIDGGTVISSIIAFEYSFPLILVKKGVFGRANLMNMTEEDLEIRYLRSHDDYLQEVRLALGGYTGTLAIRSNCTYDYGKVSCSFLHTKEGNEMMLRGTYYFDDPPSSGERQNYYKQIVSTSEGDVFRELFSKTFKTWELFERIHEAAARWKIIHKRLLEVCVPEEITVEMTIVSEPEPSASCLVSSGVPVLFVVSIHAGDDVKADMSNFQDNFYGIKVSIPITPTDGLIVTCNVESQMGWTKKQEMKVRVDGSDYAFEDVPLPWDAMFPKRSKTMNSDDWSLLSYTLELHPSTKILLLLVLVALCVMIYHLQERRRAIGLYSAPTPPPIPPQQNKKRR